jgi:hypothetical protein
VNATVAIRNSANLATCFIAASEAEGLYLARENQSAASGQHLYLTPLTRLG